MKDKQNESFVEVVKSLYWPVLLSCAIIGGGLSITILLLMELTWNCDDITGSWNSVCLKNLQMYKESNYNGLKITVPLLMITSLVISYQFRNKQQKVKSV